MALQCHGFSFFSPLQEAQRRRGSQISTGIGLSSSPTRCTLYRNMACLLGFCTKYTGSRRKYAFILFILFHGVLCPAFPCFNSISLGPPFSLAVECIRTFSSGMLVSGLGMFTGINRYISGYQREEEARGMGNSKRIERRNIHVILDYPNTFPRAEVPRLSVCIVERDTPGGGRMRNFS